MSENKERSGKQEGKVADLKDDVLSSIDIEKVFILNKVLSDPKSTFKFNARSINEVKADAIIVVDTNVLLLPYNAGATAFQKIIQLYKKYHMEKRLYVPIQVIREFLRNRPSKITELHQGLSDKISKLQCPDISYPILENIEAYKNINEAIERLKDLKKEINDNNRQILDQIKSWEWTDPVFDEYKGVFADDNIVDNNLKDEALVEDLTWRKKHSIPPGYKDSTKEDGGIGDLLIWKTILTLGNMHKKDLIFVTGEEKPDWYHRSGGKALIPRYELIEEYRKESKGKMLFLVSLSQLLELFSMEEEVVDEIRQEEYRLQKSVVLVSCPDCGQINEWKLKDEVGSSAKPECIYCKLSFHIHRTADGVTVHKDSESNIVNDGTAWENRVETVNCPICSTEHNVMLSLRPASTKWIHCQACDNRYPIHRIRDGSIKISQSF